MRLLFALAICTLMCGTVRGADLRTWASADEKFTVEARLVDIETNDDADDVVVIEDEAGKKYRVSLKKLSEKDREYVEARKSGASSWDFTSKNAQAAVKRYQAAVDRATKSYEEDRRRSLQRLIRDLEKERKTATRAEDLDEAVRIRDAIRVLEMDDVPGRREARIGGTRGGQKANRVYRRTAAAGGKGDWDHGHKTFQVNSEADEHVVGFELTRYTLQGRFDVVKSIKAIYRSKNGLRETQTFGTPQGNVTRIIAKDGYAVGGLYTQSAGRISSVRVIFMKIKKGTLDPHDSYQSESYGPAKEPTELLGGDGYPVTGIYGENHSDLVSFGLVQPVIAP